MAAGEATGMLVRVGLWASCVSLGLVLLWNYESRPGARLHGADQWPAHAQAQPVPDRYNLVISLHPRCPCSKASIEELYKIVAHARGRLHVLALLYAPSGGDETWTDSDMAKSLKLLPDITLVTDTDGQEATRFGALTSGDTQLFAPDRQRLFHGGITASRGHAGDNDGSDAILAFLNGARDARRETPVYGCAIQTPATGTRP